MRLSVNVNSIERPMLYLRNARSQLLALTFIRFFNSPDPVLVGLALCPET